MQARYMVVVSIALVLMTGGTARAHGVRGDLNCDGSLDNFDIDAFVLVLTGTPPDYTEYYAQYPTCSHMLADADCDGQVTNFDIDAFVQCITGGCTACLSADMVVVFTGEFEMGDPLIEGDADELPVHDVNIDSFYMEAYETTNAQYCLYLNSAHALGLVHVDDDVVYQAGGTTYPYCETYASTSFSGIDWDGGVFTPVADREDYPAVVVTWYGAVAYCNWRSSLHGRTPAYDLGTWECNFSANGYRLPTEAEWEKAAGWDPALEYHYRFGENTDGCGLDCLDGQRANYWDSGDPFEGVMYPETSPVGYYDGTNHDGYQTADAPSHYGCYDMSGNVWEWCNDWYSPTYYGSSPYDNPTGPATGTYRVLRGGDANSYVDDCRSANRDYCRPGNHYYIFGFRCAAGTP